MAVCVLLFVNEKLSINDVVTGILGREIELDTDADIDSVFVYTGHLL